MMLQALWPRIQSGLCIWPGTLKSVFNQPCKKVDRYKSKWMCSLKVSRIAGSCPSYTKYIKSYSPRLGIRCRVSVDKLVLNRLFGMSDDRPTTGENVAPLRSVWLQLALHKDSWQYLMRMKPGERKKSKLSKKLWVMFLTFSADECLKNKHIYPGAD